MYFTRTRTSWNSFSVHPDKIASAANGRPDLFEQFKKDNNVLRFRVYRPRRTAWPPYHDHGRTYQIKYLGRQRQVDVFHVYVGPNNELWDDICKKTLAWAGQHKKVAEIYDSSHSWYYHDEAGMGTAIIIIHDPETSVKIA